MSTKMIPKRCQTIHQSPNGDWLALFSK